MHQFVKQSRIAAPPGEVFAFHESPGALERLIPPWEHVKLIESSGSIHPGARVVMRTRIGPFPVDWVAEHTEYEPGRLFADRQVHGPFAYWYHRHIFLDDGDGGTILRDEVDYRPPLGRLGDWLGGRFVATKLRKMFDYRHETTRRIVESGDFARAGGAE
jgi:ligand-binding SRPBCC domain-containing protein